MWCSQDHEYLLNNDWLGTNPIFLSVTFFTLLQDEEANLPQIMMSKKTKRLYGRMQHGLQKKRESIDRLVEKRKAIEETEAPKKSSKKLKNK
jgi:hypothetical protein